MHEEKTYLLVIFKNSVMILKPCPGVSRPDHTLGSGGYEEREVGNRSGKIFQPARCFQRGTNLQEPRNSGTVISSVIGCKTEPDNEI